LNEILFYKDNKVKVNEVNLPNDKLRVLGSNLLLFYSDITRKADPILQKQKEKAKENFNTLLEMRNQVPVLKKHLEAGENDSLGHILKQAWILKKSLLATITNKKIDEIYEKALNAGAYGGKICGAGGGGFLLIYVPRERQNKVREALKGHREVPFMLDKYGSRIIFNQMSDYWR
jgi:D-glycero-alpha-D-manno-heptose-7-phosphate kinase